MKIIIKATNIKLSPSITQYIEEKIGGLEKFLKSFNPELTEARVEVGKITRGQRQGDIFRAEVNLSLNGRLIRVERTEESLSAAIDFAKDDLQREIRQYKDKKSTMFVRGARSWKKFWRVSPLARFRSSKVNKIIRRK
jgi:putative sigma-54 modulation protein